MSFSLSGKTTESSFKPSTTSVGFSSSNSKVKWPNPQMIPKTMVPVTNKIFAFFILGKSFDLGSESNNQLDNRERIISNKYSKCFYQPPPPPPPPPPPEDPPPPPEKPPDPEVVPGGVEEALVAPENEVAILEENAPALK